MTYRDTEIWGGVSVGNDQFSTIYDPYIPILNEPMGREFNTLNFEPTDIKSNNTPLGPVKKNYEYIPLSYKTDSISYLDGLKPVKEAMSNFSLDYEINLNTIVLFIFLIVIAFLLYKNYKTNKKLVKLMKHTL
jgi:hypothetical protein